ncbi:MAG: site-specific integrase [Sphingomonas sp.]
MHIIAPTRPGCSMARASANISMPPNLAVCSPPPPAPTPQAACSAACFTTLVAASAKAWRSLPRRLDVESKRIVFRTLKRRKLIFRAVPVPAAFMRELVAFACDLRADDRLFPWCRQTGYRRICALMEAAEIKGPQASPKGLRHQFGIHAIGLKIPESAVGRWLGHASPKSTRVYTVAVGTEERALAKRMW